MLLNFVEKIPGTSGQHYQNAQIRLHATVNPIFALRPL